MNSRIHVDDVNKTYSSSGNSHTALSGMSMTVPSGTFTALVGPSGCGKSTLLNILAGFERVSGGRCTINEQQVSRPNPNVGFVFQQPALFPWKNVWGNITLGPRCAGMAKDELERRARALIEDVGLQGFEKSYPYQLSGGMAQRVQLARVLISQPDVLLLDEPFGALDYQTRLRMQELLLRLWAEYSPTVVFITHDVDEAIFLADRVEIMSKSPGAICDAFDVDLPRPRPSTVITAPQFSTYRARVMGALGLIKVSDTNGGDDSPDAALSGGNESEVSSSPHGAGITLGEG